MRIRLEATRAELADGEHLVEGLARALLHSSPEASEILEKALTFKEVQLRYPVLQTMKEQAREEYQRALQNMIAEIEGALAPGKPPRTPVPAK
jgi:hypothetical protein